MAPYPNLRTVAQCWFFVFPFQIKALLSRSGTPSQVVGERRWGEVGVHFSTRNKVENGRELKTTFAKKKNFATQRKGKILRPILLGYFENISSCGYENNF